MFICVLKTKMVKVFAMHREKLQIQSQIDTTESTC